MDTARWQDNQQSRASSQLTQGRVERPIQKGAPKLAIRSVDGLTYRSLGRARCSCLAQSCLCHSIRANIAVVLMPKEFGKPLSGAVHPALDRANRNTADHRHLLVAQTFGSDQQHRLTLLVRKPRQSTAKFGKLHAPRLVREDGELSREQAVSILHLALTPAVLGVEQVTHQREEPSLQLGAGLKLLPLLQCAQDGVLNQIIRPVTIPNQGQGERAEVRRHQEKVGAEVGLTLSRRCPIPNWRGRKRSLERGWAEERVGGRGIREMRLYHRHCPWNARWRTWGLGTGRCRHARLLWSAEPKHWLWPINSLSSQVFPARGGAIQGNNKC